MNAIEHAKNVAQIERALIACDRTTLHSRATRWTTAGMLLGLLISLGGIPVLGLVGFEGFLPGVILGAGASIAAGWVGGKLFNRHISRRLQTVVRAGNEHPDALIEARESLENHGMYGAAKAVLSTTR